MPGPSTTNAIFIVHCAPVTRKVPSRQQDTVHGLCWAGENIWSCTQAWHLVGSSQTWHQGVAGAAHTEHVWKCQKQSVCWLQSEWRIQCESVCSPAWEVRQRPMCRESQGRRHKPHFLWLLLWTRFHHKMPCCVGQIQQAPAHTHPRSFPITSRGTAYKSCVGSSMLHASETWDPTLSDLYRLQRNARAMIRWICGVTTKDHIN